MFSKSRSKSPKSKTLTQRRSIATTTAGADMQYGTITETDKWYMEYTLKQELLKSKKQCKCDCREEEVWVTKDSPRPSTKYAKSCKRFEEW